MKWLRIKVRSIRSRVEVAAEILVYKVFFGKRVNFCVRGRIRICGIRVGV